ncbi:MAG: hypothetical protein HYZ68_05950, partial [Chloroflexi bacterium]|nr:hypothetical protein [Chloroflexota bacterium]
TPILNGLISEEEWASAILYTEDEAPLAALYFGLDTGRLYLRLDSTQPWDQVADELFIYITVPRATSSNSFSRYGRTSAPKTVLGIAATHEMRVDLETGAALLSQAAEGEAWSTVGPLEQVGLAPSALEIGIPFGLLGDLEPGDRLGLVAVLSRQGRDVTTAPSAGPMEIVLPDLGQTRVLLEVIDPQRDDHGPGSYIYPTDRVFQPQVFDLKRFIVGQDEHNLVFKFELHGPIVNVWDSPLGLSVQALDVYIDVDGQAGSGARTLLPGRNAALAPEDAWDYVIWVEGWTQGLYAPDANGDPQKLDVTLKVIVDPAQRAVTIRVPKEAIGEDPENWGYVGLVLSQEGFPSPGVWRIRDVLPQPAQWRFGGGPEGVTNYPHIIDLAWPEGGQPSQEEILSAYTPSGEADLAALSPDLFAILPLLRIP